MKQTGGSSTRMVRRCLLGHTVVIVLLSAYPAAIAAAHEADVHRRSISVTGRAEVAVSPDIVRVTFSVESTAPTAAAAAEDNRNRAQRLIATVRSFVADEGLLMTTGYRLMPLYEVPEPGRGRTGKKQTLIGYRASNEVMVELRNLARVGELVDAAIANGADSVANVQFDLSDRRAALRQAVGKAGRDAAAQAEEIAQALGVRLGHIYSIATTPEPIRLPQQRIMGAEAIAAAARTPVEPGQVTISASVQAVYEIAE